MPREIREGRDSGDAHATAVFEPLPIIAGERRLHVRAYHYWRARADGRAMPTLDDCADIDQAGFADRMLLIDLAKGDRAVRIRKIGRDLAEELPASDTIGQASAGAGLVDELVARLPTVSLQRAPIGFEADAPEGEGAGISFRGILLPLADKDGAIAHVLGVMSWRKVAAQAPTDDIIAAVASATMPSTRDQSPSPWSAPASRKSAPMLSRIEDHIGAAKTRVALSGTDRMRATLHFHAAIGAAYDAVVDATRDEERAVLRAIFAEAVETSSLERVIAQARLLAIDGRALARRLDAEPDGIAGFIARWDAVNANRVPEPVRLRFRLTPLGPELLASARRRAPETGAMPSRRATG